MSAQAPLYEPQEALLDLLDAEFGESGAEDLRGPNGESVPFELWHKALYGPLRHFLARPGKEFRARLVEAAWTLGGGGAMPRDLPRLVEILHAGSLIIDDIEDGSAHRRGDRALHCEFGMPLALNAGNWLYFWPDVLLPRLGLGPATELTLRRHIGRTLLRCHNGQALDLSVMIHDVPQASVRDVVATTTSLKTGSLFELAAVVGAAASGASADRTRAIARYGNALGTGLQMLDDLSGIMSERRCHKGHEDLVGARPTWPWAWLATDLPAPEYAALAALGRRVASRDRHPELLAKEIRKALGPLCKRRVSQHLAAAATELEEAIGASSTLRELRREIELLEASYG